MVRKIRKLTRDSSNRIKKETLVKETDKRSLGKILGATAILTLGAIGGYKALKNKGKIIEFLKNLKDTSPKDYLQDQLKNQEDPAKILRDREMEVEKQRLEREKEESRKILRENQLRLARERLNKEKEEQLRREKDFENEKLERMRLQKEKLEEESRINSLKNEERRKQLEFEKEVKRLEEQKRIEEEKTRNETKEQYERERASEEEKRNRTRALELLKEEIRKVKGLYIQNEEEVCKNLTKLFKFIEISCKYSRDVEECKIKRLIEYNIDTRVLNEARAMLNC